MMDIAIQLTEALRAESRLEITLITRSPYHCKPEGTCDKCPAGARAAANA